MAMVRVHGRHVPENHSDARGVKVDVVEEPVEVEKAPAKRVVKKKDAETAAVKKVAVESADK